jgi:hypothetical protein
MPPVPQRWGGFQAINKVKIVSLIKSNDVYRAHFRPGTASINATGNFAVFAAPYATRLAKDTAGGFTTGLLAVAFLPFLSAILMLILGDDSALVRGILFRGRARQRKQD